MSSFGQPPIPAERLAATKGHLLRYRIMAFTTGVVLLTGTIALILKASGVDHLHMFNVVLWTAHGYLYLIYVVVAAILGFSLRWPIGRMVLVILSGTIPTASFIAEHYVTRAIRAAAESQAVPSRD